MGGKQLLSREKTRAVICPACTAPVGEPCQGRSGLRLSNHRERMDRALQVLAAAKAAKRQARKNERCAHEGGHRVVEAGIACARCGVLLPGPSLIGSPNVPTGERPLAAALAGLRRRPRPPSLTA